MRVFARQPIIPQTCQKLSKHRLEMNVIQD
jgi:hypothetical protein